MRVRLETYRFLIERQRFPSPQELARALASTSRRVLAALRKLEKGHAIALEENAAKILRAAPFWAVPTPFQVSVGKKSWWGSCIWDALGIPAMLKRDARITTGCGCCSQQMELVVKDGSLVSPAGVIHFAVPARHWYDDIVFT